MGCVDIAIRDKDRTRTRETGKQKEDRGTWHGMVDHSRCSQANLCLDKDKDKVAQIFTMENRE